MLTVELLHRMWPQCERHMPGVIAGIVASEDAVLAKYGITSTLVLAHAMAQFSHEFGGGTEAEENLSYSSAARIAAVWPSRFTPSSALAYVRNPRKLADKVYNGRMGNEPDSDDGYDFRGRGLSQVTGREGYAKLSEKTGLPLLDDPDLVNSPEHIFECGIADFVLCGCLPFAERDDVRGVTHHLNGGFIGESEREQWLRKWKAALETPAAPVIHDGSLRYGDKGWQVKAAQDRLAELGYMVGKADSDFGAATRAGVLSFQADSGLPTTGIIDDATRTAMADAPAKPISEDRATADADDLRAAGSVTVAKADSSNMVAKGIAIVSAAAGSEQAGLLDKARDATDQFGTMRSVVDAAQDAIQWASSHWYFAAIVAAGALWYFGHGIIERRVADHRDGSNMGR